MADEKFNVAKVNYKMGQINDHFEEFARTLDKINAFVETNVNASLASSAFGSLGGKLLAIWDHNASTFGDFYKNFDNWSQVVAVITANNNSFAVDAAATYRDTAGSLDGVKEAREIVKENEGLDNIASATGFGMLSSNARSVLDFAYMAKTEKTSNNNIYGGNTISYTDAVGNKVDILYDKDGYLVGKKVTDKNGSVTYYDKDNQKVDKLPTAEEYEEQLKKIEEELSSKYYKDYIQNLKYGSFEKESFKASNGVTINYYLYIPDYGTEVEGLPVLMYMHGSGESGNGTLNCGLPKFLSEKSTTPSGIVICPQAPSSSAYYQDNYLQALNELTTYIANQNNGDLNKISLSGHSYGAYVGYKLVNKYPNYYSAFVPISGPGQVSDAVKNVNLWAFHGSNDTSVDYTSAKNAVSKLKNSGAPAEMHTFQGSGHGGVQNYTFEKEYQREDGQIISPLEWAFEQEKLSKL